MNTLKSGQPSDPRHDKFKILLHGAFIDTSLPLTMTWAIILSEKFPDDERYFFSYSHARRGEAAYGRFERELLSAHLHSLRFCEVEILWKIVFSFLFFAFKRNKLCVCFVKALIIYVSVASFFAFIQSLSLSCLQVLREFSKIRILFSWAFLMKILSSLVAHQRHSEVK